MSRTRYKIFDGEIPHFMTCTVVNWLPVFVLPDITAIILDSFKHLIEHKRLEIFAYTIMVHHLHFIAASKQLSKEVGIFKSYTARKIIDYMEAQNISHYLKQFEYYKLKHKTDRKYQVWQEGNQPKQIKDDSMMRQKINYIHDNAVECGFVDEPVHWRYSSARNYADMEGLLDVTLFSL